MNKNKKALFTSNSDNWATPITLYNYFINNNYYDPCPLNSIYNGLETKWSKYNFINPPFSLISEFIETSIIHANQSSRNKFVLLIPSRTDTKYFHKLLNFPGSVFYFIKGRLKFNDTKNSAPFPSVLIFLNFNSKNELYFIIQDIEFLGYNGKLLK